MNNDNAMLCALLGCGSQDVEFIDSELDKFDVGAGEVVESIRESDSDRIDINTFLYHLYRIALDNAISEVEAESDLLDGDDNVSIFTNCLDSHLHIKDSEGNQCEIHDYDELVEFLRANYKSEFSQTLNMEHYSKEYVILRPDGKLLCFSGGETIFYGGRKEAENDCCADEGDLILELTIRHDDANAAIPKNEQVVRVCPETGFPVVAVHRGDGSFICLHNDSAEEDAQAVRNWIASNGKNPNPDGANIHITNT